MSSNNNKARFFLRSASASLHNFSSTWFAWENFPNPFDKREKKIPFSYLSFSFIHDFETRLTLISILFHHKLFMILLNMLFRYVKKFFFFLQFLVVVRRWDDEGRNVKWMKLIDFSVWFVLQSIRFRFRFLPINILSLFKVISLSCDWHFFIRCSLKVR